VQEPCESGASPLFPALVNPIVLGRKLAQVPFDDQRVAGRGGAPAQQRDVLAARGDAPNIAQFAHDGRLLREDLPAEIHCEIRQGVAAGRVPLMIDARPALTDVYACCGACSLSAIRSSVPNG
jgi:hypothetical protein